MPTSSASHVRRDHLAELLDRRPQLRPLGSDIRRAADMLLGSFRNGGNVLIAGNGGMRRTRTTGRANS